MRFVQGSKEEDSVFSDPLDVEGLGSTVFSSIGIATVVTGVLEVETSTICIFSFSPLSLMFSSSASSSEKFSIGE